MTGDAQAQPAPRAEHFPHFDAIRGIATIAVLTAHGLYQQAVAADVGEWWWRFGNHLDAAVPVFLCMSGFLLYRPFVAARLRGRPLPSLKAYAVRRVARVGPALWFALTVLTLWFWNNPEVAGFEQVRDNPWLFYGFAQIYDADTALAGIGQAWTVDVEATFYLWLPLWIVIAWRRALSMRVEIAGLLVLMALSIAWKAFMLSQADPNDRADLVWILPLPTWFDMFISGMVLAVASAHGYKPPLIGRFPGIAWAIALAFWLTACFAVGPDGTTHDPVTDGIYFWRHLCYLGFIFFVCVPAVFGPWGQGWVRKVLSLRAAAYIGTISYSFYLFHFHVIGQQYLWWGRAPDGELEWVLWYGGALAGSVILGTIGFRLVEGPFMRLGARYGRKAPAPSPNTVP